MTQIATVACLLLIAVLFRLNRDRRVRVSVALWIPTLWLILAGSRSVSEWMQVSQPAIETVDRYSEGSPIDRNTRTVLIALGAIALSRRQRQMRRVLAANGEILLFFAYCGVSVVWSDYPDIGLKRWFRAIGDVIVVLVILTEADWTAALQRVLARIGFVLIPLSALFVRYYPEIGRAYGIDGTPYWSGVTTNKNGLGMLCLTVGLGVLWLLLSVERDSRNRNKRLFAYATVFLLSLWLLVISDSKTSLSCLFMIGSLMVLTTISHAGRKPAILGGLSFILVGGAFAVLFLGIGGGALEAMGRNATLTGRTDVWRVVLKYAENPVVGAGYESFWLGSRLMQIGKELGFINQAHNGYIEIYLNLGLIGVALLVLLILSGYQSVMKGVQRRAEGVGVKLAFLLMGVIYNFTEGMFKMNSLIWVCFLIAVMKIPRSTIGASGREPEPLKTLTEQELYPLDATQAVSYWTGRGVAGSLHPHR